MSKIFLHIIWGLVYAVSLLPLRFFYFLSDIAAWLLCNIFSYRKSVIYINLSRSFPDADYGQIRRIAKDYYRYMCDIMVESVWQISATAGQMGRILEVRDTDLMDEMIGKHDKIVVMMGHRGNWEMVGAFCGEKEKRTARSFANYPMAITYKIARGKVANFLFEKMRMQEYRKYGVAGHIIGSKQVLRHIVSGQGKNTYIFIADQYPSRGGIPVRFLNQDTFFFEGAEFVARRMNMPVIYLDIVREKRGKYRMSFELISENSKECGTGEITYAYAKLLEKSILQNRYNWLWSHKRWKRAFTEQDKEECRKVCG